MINKNYSIGTCIHLESFFKWHRYQSGRGWPHQSRKIQLFFVSLRMSVTGYFLRVLGVKRVFPWELRLFEILFLMIIWISETLQLKFFFSFKTPSQRELYLHRWFSVNTMMFIFVLKQSYYNHNLKMSTTNNKSCTYFCKNNKIIFIWV